MCGPETFAGTPVSHQQAKPGELFRNYVLAAVFFCLVLFAVYKRFDFHPSFCNRDAPRNRQAIFIVPRLLRTSLKPKLISLQSRGPRIRERRASCFSVKAEDSFHMFELQRKS